MRRALPALGPTRQAGAARDGRADAAQRADRDRHPAAVGAAGGAAAADPVRSGATWPGAASLLAQTLLSGTGRCPPWISPPSCRRVGGGLAAGVGPGPAADLGQRAGHRAGPDPGDPGARCSPARRYPEREVATERDRLVDRIQVAQSQPAHLARVALLRRIYGRHPYAVQTPGARAGAGGRRRRRCAPCTTSGCTRPGRRWSSSGDMTPDRRWTPPSGRWAAGTAAASEVTLPPTPPLAPGPLAAGRPAGLGAVVDADGAAGGRRAPTPTTPRCSWPTSSSAATSRPVGWRTSARTRATRTARTR